MPTTNFGWQFLEVGGSAVAVMNANLADIDADVFVAAAGLHTLYVPATDMVGAVTAGATVSSVEMTTNKNNLHTLAFADTAAKVFASFQVTLPKSWNEGTVTWRAHWTLNSTSTNSAVWGLQAVAVSDNEVLDVAYGTAVELTDAGLGTAYKKHVTATSAALTIAGTPLAGDTLDFRLYRDSAHASDTLAVSINLLGIEIFYTTNAATDL